MANKDRALIKGFLDGDQAAINKIKSWVHSAIVRFANAGNFPEDLLQDILVQLIEHFRQPEYEKINNLKGWIKIKAKSHCIDRLRQEKTQKRGGRKIRLFKKEDIENNEPIPVLGEKLERMLEISLDYIDMIYRKKRQYMKDSKNYLPLLKMKHSFSEAKKLILAAGHNLHLTEEEIIRILAPPWGGLQKGIQEVDAQIFHLSSQDDIEWPLDFNEFVGEIHKVRLSPAKMIFRVWKLILKKGNGRYSDNEAIRDKFEIFKEKYRGTEKEFLFNIKNSDPYVMRKEAQRDSKMKKYYDRLAGYIFKKSTIDFRFVAEENEWENKHSFIGETLLRITKDGTFIDRWTKNGLKRGTAKYI